VVEVAMVAMDGGGDCDCKRGLILREKKSETVRERERERADEDEN
jgi:hypothetical protein